MIVGHHNVEREFNEEEYENGSTLYSYKELHNKLVKPTLECINNNKDFFDKLDNVNEIFFFGFSFSNADLDYIKKIQKL